MPVANLGAIYCSSSNDGVNYRLHYVSAREAYNIVCAAEDVLSGNPSQYLDYEIPPYAHLLMNVSSPYRLVRWSEDVLFNLLDDPAEVTIRFHAADLERTVYESPDTCAWLAFDGEIQVSDDECTLHDPTPSRWYRVTPPPGECVVNWDGTNARGVPVASGLYICRLQSGNSVRQTRMTLLR
ncbi:MAG: hypothetical protein KJ970_09520 [Candidatus Eisenbacteria bacterium]|uniref:FlgD Ig-like domain-containing protein n=1 Tax=Eiseniibacteriota bacterium TaxID=2212470 RepID=A0A948RX43_UNCEI|nr:hypothetical protein [Candidatus Eisenbacteria bacterium]MBU1950502.1 hypothetical protein [Candidatus Eisenbacteria bacterium]MBU2691157.1 hypothetical protein [Candidatus Eisenbacteria bacterium]